jgi:hypothetical protein
MIANVLRLPTSAEILDMNTRQSLKFKVKNGAKLYLLLPFYANQTVVSKVINCFLKVA